MNEIAASLNIGLAISAYSAVKHFSKRLFIEAKDKKHLSDKSVRCLFSLAVFAAFAVAQIVCGILGAL
jgi:hypothetical protein